MKYIYIIFLSFIFSSALQSQTLIQKGEDWKYLDDGTDVGNTWVETSFDDSEWKEASALFGYGGVGYFIVSTTIDYGSNEDNKYITTYFRKNFLFDNTDDNISLKFNTLVDDGAVVYLNGIELYRFNLDDDNISYKTLASASGNDYEYQQVIVRDANLLQGNNVLAVEVHQSSASTSDMGFDLELIAIPDSVTPVIENIHFGTENDALNGLTITWQSNGLNDKIKWGYTSEYEMGIFDGIMHNKFFKNLFDYTFPSLTSNTIIYYSIYNSTSDKWSSQKEYGTSKSVDSDKFTFTAFGDSRTFYSDWNKISKAVPKTDFSLFLGDIASVGGSVIDWENWFRTGSEYLENNVVYHCIGNHDARSDGLYKYKDVLVLPRNKYNNETFYSFEYGNAIFIYLNSESAGSASQYSWLLETLETFKNKRWKIVIFHSPFYTSPKHVGEMDDYFSTWWKAFDDYGIDLIFNGHTHNYQRTKPINRNINTSGAVYEYGSGSNQGRCQIVAGSAGAPQYDVGVGWFIEKSLSIRHYCLIEIDNYNMKVLTKDEKQNILDSVSFVKTPSQVTGYTNNSYHIYPNPTKGYITVNTGDLNATRIEVYDTTGRLLLYQDELLKENRINLSKLKSGIYNVSIISDKGRFTEMITIK